jgi:hypothetical protein
MPSRSCPHQNSRVFRTTFSCSRGQVLGDPDRDGGRYVIGLAAVPKFFDPAVFRAEARAQVSSDYFATRFPPRPRLWARLRARVLLRSESCRPAGDRSGAEPCRRAADCPRCAATVTPPLGANRKPAGEIGASSGVSGQARAQPANGRMVRRSADPLLAGIELGA